MTLPHRLPSAANLPPRILGAVNLRLAVTAARFTVGILLLVASALKLAQLMSSDWPTLLWWPKNALQLLAVAYEFTLAVWLISGLRAAESRLVALWTFGIFLGIVFSTIVRGGASCGCYGSLRTPPKLSLLIDALATSALLACRYKEVAAASLISSRLWIARLLTWGWLPLSCAIVCQQIGSRGMNGGPIDIPSEALALGEIAGDQVFQVTVPLRNLSSSTVVIDRLSASCGCTSVVPTTFSLGPDEVRSVQLRLDFAHLDLSSWRGNSRSISVDITARLGVPNTLSQTWPLTAVIKRDQIPSIPDELRLW